MLLSRQVQQSPAHKRKLAGYVSDHGHASAAGSDGAGDGDDILQAHARKRRLNDAFDALSLSQDSLLRHAVRQPQAQSQSQASTGRHAHAQTVYQARNDHAQAVGSTAKRRASTEHSHDTRPRAYAEDVGMRDPSSFERDKHTIVITSLDDSDDDLHDLSNVPSPYFASSASASATTSSSATGSGNGSGSVSGSSSGGGGGGVSHDPEYAVDARHIPAFSATRLPFGGAGVLPPTPHVADGAMVLYRGPAASQVAASLAQPLSSAFPTAGAPVTGQAGRVSTWSENEDYRHTAWDDQSSRFEELDDEYDDDSLDDMLTGMSDADVDVVMELD